MRARTLVEVDAGGVLRTLECAAPLTVRRLRDPDPAVCALCLVGTAAGPLSGDDLALELTVAAGARASLSAAGASIAQGRAGGARAALRLRARVGAGARLVADPGAMIVAAGADVEVTVTLDLAAEAEVEWREVVVLGRTGEEPGRAVLHWDVHRGGRPLLRSDIDLSGEALRRWAGMLGGHRVIASTLRAGPGVEARTRVAAGSFPGCAVTQRLGEHAELHTVLAASAAAASSPA